jgi:hypothetical protein
MARVKSSSATRRISAKIVSMVLIGFSWKVIPETVFSYWESSKYIVRSTPTKRLKPVFALDSRFRGNDRLSNQIQ